MGKYNPYTMSNSTPNEARQRDDYYATDPDAVVSLLNKLKSDNLSLPNLIWENACGGGHISTVLSEYGYKVYSTDIIDRGYKNFSEIKDFLLFPSRISAETLAILTNPPFKYAREFVETAMDLLNDGEYCIYLFRIQLLESAERKKLFAQYPIKYVYVYSDRIKVEKNGEFEKYNAKTQCFAWFIWQKGYKGDTIVRWI